MKNLLDHEQDYFNLNNKNLKSNTNSSKDQELIEINSNSNYNRTNRERIIFSKEEILQSAMKKKNVNQNEEPLIEKEEKPKELSDFAKGAVTSLWSSVIGLFSSNQFSQLNRSIFFNGQCYPYINSPNVIRNQKYSALLLIPLCLFNQFKFFSNLFFLLITLSQFIPELKIGFMFTYYAPLAVVVTITLIKEAVDDYKRYLRDKELNSKTYNKVTKTGLQQIPSMSIKMGDIIQLHPNERIPADMILLKTSDKSGEVFIRTDQLDGETDWKHRKPIKYTQNISDGDYISLLDQDLSVLIDPPNNYIYRFQGSFSRENGAKESLSLDNTLWANTVLASSISYGLVIYTGKETRAQMNSSEPTSKVGQIENELNVISKGLFIMMLILSFLLVFLSGINGSIESNIILTFRFLLLLCSIIPISLRVNLDFAKLIYSYQINSDDKHIPGTITRNSTIPEELGRIQYLFTDKTGTLTQNEMIFKKICFESIVMSEDSIVDLNLTITDECNKSKGPMKDVEEIYTFNEENIQNSGRKRIRRNRNNIIRDSITALCVCHNVTPIEENGERQLQASSPDEVALVKLAESVGFKLLERNSNGMKIQTPSGSVETYEIIACFPFSSDTKRMGILVKYVEGNRIIFYLKGAEVVMETKVSETSKAFIREYCENLASTGLRTLVITQKYVPESFYEDWITKYEQANLLMTGRDAKVRSVIEELEKGMEFLCVTGVEDLLQVDVTDTIESLRNGGIQIWMLTGDKIETAKCIAISTGLKSKGQKSFDIVNIKKGYEFEREIKKYSNLNDHILVIDGTTLDIALSSDYEEIFFNISKNAPAVVCCRCSPTQKALIVRGMNKYTNARTAAIGDGGNDVAMIQEAHLGIGIVGKEGKQASMAADFSILEFRVIKVLILWHGRLSYYRSAVLAQFVIHRGLIISIIQFVFSIMFYFISIPIYNGFLMLGYATLFTSAPVFSIIFDEDTNFETVMSFPVMYKTLQKGRFLSLKTFSYWLFKSIFQGAFIMIFTVTVFENNFTNIVTITFTVLIFIEIVNVYSEVRKFYLFRFILYIS